MPVGQWFELHLSAWILLLLSFIYLFVGQWFELHLSAWMQPSANIIERAVLHKSAPVCAEAGRA